MCGIVGYVGSGSSTGLLLEGLRRLEHRGYDSAGVATLQDGRLRCVKRSGRVSELARAATESDEPLDGPIGIGHTRWATHGAATDGNAHPHLSADGRVAVVHNGIIDNAAELRRALSADGVELASDTDSEVIAHLLARSTASTLAGQLDECLSQLSGTYGIAVLHADFPDQLAVARQGSPLIVGVAEGGVHVTSDLAAMVQHTTTVAYLEDGERAVLTSSGFMTHRQGEAARAGSPIVVDIDPLSYEAGEHASFMLKEMHEQPATVERALRGRLNRRVASTHLGGLEMTSRELRSFSRVKILGCGSAYYAGQMGASMIEELARVPADAEAASEFRYRNPVIEPDTLYVAVSQSGETVDTLLAVQEIRRKGGRCLGVVNVVGSAIARECDGGIYLHAGPEVAVASTKALTAMYVAFAMLALQLGRVRDLSAAEGLRMIDALEALPGVIQSVLDEEKRIAELGAELASAESLFFVGRVRGYGVAREGAQKFKEITYRHAEAYQTSELKHGPLALISPAVPTVALVPQDELTGRNVAALHEIAARGGPLIVVTHESVDLGELSEIVRRIDVPPLARELDPIVMTIPLQLMSYYAAEALGLDADKPRNLAKSVTVE